MGLLSKKRSVKLEEFCQEFYDTFIFEETPVIAGLKANDTIYKTTYRDKIIEVDPGFEKTNANKFSALMTLLRIELFGLAWMHKFGEESSVKQSIFTQEYLYSIDKEDIWQALEPFNQVIGQTSISVYDTSKPFQRASYATVIQTRANSFDNFIAKGYDSECVARALNRTQTDQLWKKLMAPHLMLKVFKSLNYEPNEEAQFRMTAFIRGFYDGASQAIENIKIAK